MMIPTGALVRVAGSTSSAIMLIILVLLMSRSTPAGAASTGLMGGTNRGVDEVFQDRDSNIVPLRRTASAASTPDLVVACYYYPCKQGRTDDGGGGGGNWQRRSHAMPRCFPFHCVGWHFSWPLVYAVHI